MDYAVTREKSYGAGKKVPTNRLRGELIMHRKMTIEILKNGDVRYGIWRSMPFKWYLIEYPSDNIVIKEENKMNVGGFRKSIEANNFLKLSWNAPQLYDLSYIKQGKCINHIFNDEFKTKQDVHNGDTGYWFWLSWEDSLTLDIRNSLICWNNMDLLNNRDENQEKGLFINSHWERGFHFYFGKSGMLKFTLRFI